jgi:hypothetical protein
MESEGSNDIYKGRPTHVKRGVKPCSLGSKKVKDRSYKRPVNYNESCGLAFHKNEVVLARDSIIDTILYDAEVLEDVPESDDSDRPVLIQWRSREGRRVRVPLCYITKMSDPTTKLHQQITGREKSLQTPKTLSSPFAKGNVSRRRDVTTASFGSKCEDYWCKDPSRFFPNLGFEKVLPESSPFKDSRHSVESSPTEDSNHSVDSQGRREGTTASFFRSKCEDYWCESPSLFSPNAGSEKMLPKSSPTKDTRHLVDSTEENHSADSFAFHKNELVYARDGVLGGLFDAVVLEDVPREANPGNRVLILWRTQGLRQRVPICNLSKVSDQPTRRNRKITKLFTVPSGKG